MTDLSVTLNGLERMRQNLLPAQRVAVARHYRKEGREEVIKDIGQIIRAMDDPFTPSEPGWDKAVERLKEWLVSYATID